MNTNNSKYCECKNEVKKEIDYEKRLCNLYGFCGKEIECCGSHDVSYFGLKKLTEC